MIKSSFYASKPSSIGDPVSDDPRGCPALSFDPLGSHRTLSPAVYEMIQGQQRMLVHHARAGKTHHSPDPFSHGRLVTVHTTLGAGRLVLLEWAPLEALAGILGQRLAFLAQLLFSPVLPPAINADHCLDSFPFPCHSPMQAYHNCVHVQ
jgi:hypothetical protein